MRISRFVAAGAAALLTIGFGIVAASPASADQVWIQSIGRASADAVCPDSDPADLARGWSKWAPTWEKWMNDGAGGWTCTRSIVWAKATPPPSLLDCVQVINIAWFDFTGTNWLPEGTQGYTDATCTTLTGVYMGAVFVVADSQPAAQTICDAHGGGTATNFGGDYVDPRVYSCDV